MFVAAGGLRDLCDWDTRQVIAQCELYGGVPFGQFRTSRTAAPKTFFTAQLDVQQQR